MFSPEGASLWGQESTALALIPELCPRKDIVLGLANAMDHVGRIDKNKRPRPAMVTPRRARRDVTGPEPVLDHISYGLFGLNLAAKVVTAVLIGFRNLIARECQFTGQTCDSYRVTELSSNNYVSFFCKCVQS